MSPPLFVYSALVLLLAYLVRGIAGFGSGLIAIPMLTIVWPVTVVVPVVVALDYLGSASQGIGNARQIAWRELGALIPFMIGGVGLGLYALREVPAALLAKALGAFVLCYAAYLLLPLPALRASRRAAVPCGLLGGLVGTVFGTGGPFYVMYLNLRGLDKSVLRATFALNFLIDGGVRLLAFALMGLLGREALVAALAALPVVGAGLYAGGHVHTGLSQRAFAAIVSALLVLSGVTLLLKA